MSVSRGRGREEKTASMSSSFYLCVISMVKTNCWQFSKCLISGFLIVNRERWTVEMGTCFPFLPPSALRFTMVMGLICPQGPPALWLGRSFGVNRNLLFARTDNSRHRVFESYKNEFDCHHSSIRQFVHTQWDLVDQSRIRRHGRSTHLFTRMHFEEGKTYCRLYKSS